LEQGHPNTHPTRISTEVSYIPIIILRRNHRPPKPYSTSRHTRYCIVEVANIMLYNVCIAHTPSITYAQPVPTKCNVFPKNVLAVLSSAIHLRQQSRGAKAMPSPKSYDDRYSSATVHLSSHVKQRRNCCDICLVSHARVHKLN